MANKRFIDFQLKTSVDAGDYIVGYKSDATSELRATFQTLQNSLPSNFKYQGTDIKALTGNWEETFTVVQSNSADWSNDLTADLELRSLSSTWEETLTVVQSNSADWSSAQAKEYSDSKFLPLSGGDLTGMITLSNVDVLSGDTLTESISSLLITINGQQFKIPLLSL
jgi:hypothetical protein